ncbi:hypothetical protein M2353_002285 [Bacillus aerius]|nr:hypothetical protein [Bacillus aerius]
MKKTLLVALTLGVVVSLLGLDNPKGFKDAKGDNMIKVAERKPGG